MMEDLIRRPASGQTLGRFVDDRRGTSTVTSAIVFPLFIVILMGFFAVLTLLSIQWQLNEGTREASQHIGEMARYWNLTGTQMVDPFNPNEELTSTTSGVPLPGNFYELEATRVIAGRLRDLGYYTDDLISRTLVVSVTEPPLAYGPDSPPVLDVGFTDSICNQGADEEGDWREPDNVRFLVLASYEVPSPIDIPYMDSHIITLHARAFGHVQCPRWRGQREAGEFDKSIKFNIEGPHLPSRFMATPSWPTVTPFVPTATPTVSATATSAIP